MPDIDAPASLLLNRELSWLDFNARVLQEALDSRTLLLERAKFVAIFFSNLDEFFMVRVAGLRRQVAAGVTQPSPDGRTPQEQLDAIERRVRELVTQARECLDAQILPLLAERGIRFLTMKDLSPAQKQGVAEFFEAHAYPVLTPLAVDHGHPFPYISNLSISLAVEIRDPITGTEHFARVKVPRSLPRWVPVGRDDARHHFVPLEQVISAHLGALFPGMEILGCYTFRITRYSDLDLANAEEPEDLLATIEEQVFQRRFGEVVRLEVQEGMPANLRALLVDELRDDEPPGAALSERDVQESGPMLDLSDLMAIASLDIPDLRDPPFTPATPPELREEDRSIFDVIRERDILVHHPFDSFATSVERFLQTAATDEHVLAIKLTLYRTSGDTAIVRALTEAAQRGKQVAVLVELKARFDEANNISWARTLESFGVHVAYGSATLKTHTKIALVVRREGDGIRRYVHIGTGNYNTKTARTYTDVGLFTCNPAIGADASDLFNSLTGFSRQRIYRQLIVAPLGMRARFLELVARETTNARAGRPARIIVKMNSLTEETMIQALYDASQAGVEIDCLVRGICCLRPGVPGLSDRIRVISIIGRFLEHSRLWYFENDGAPEYYMGSADWMTRNFDRRVEAVTPVVDPALHMRLGSLLDVCLSDNRQAWDLDQFGHWTQRTPVGAERATHRRLLRDSWGRGRDTPSSVMAVEELSPRAVEPRPAAPPALRVLA